MLTNTPPPTHGRPAIQSGNLKLSDTTIVLGPLDREPKTPPIQFDLAGASDIGSKRKQNQDHYMIAELRRQLSVISTDVPLESCDELYGCEPGQLLVVADGMGGHSDGELASNLAVQACARYVLDMMHWFLKLSTNDEDDFLDELSQSLTSAQEALYSRSDEGQGRMGTTVTLAYILWPRMYVIHAGDSRCYVQRDGELSQLTKDHTVAQQLIDDKLMTADQAEKSAFAHVLWNCVGGSNDLVKPEVIRYRLQPGDQVLLCSDGLHGMIDDDAIASVLRSNAASEDAVKQLIADAIRGGGRDNVTTVLAKCGAS